MKEVLVMTQYAQTQISNKKIIMKNLMMRIKMILVKMMMIMSVPAYILAKNVLKYSQRRKKN